jgi:membrane protein implicated in regulation of membrane protease activity
MLSWHQISPRASLQKRWGWGDFDMKKRSWSRRVLLRYVLLQLPGLAAVMGIIFLVRHWAVFPDYYVWIAVSLWVAKDAVLFPYVWHAYDWDDPRHTRSMIGKQGQAKEKLDPGGYVQIGGELWRAETKDASPSIGEGEWVTVVEMDGLLLIVKSDDRKDS